MTTRENALIAPSRSAEIPEAADVYGWLIGSWALDVRRFGVDGIERRGSGEVHFAWVLEGRAVQDVWIMPNTYGITVRVWDRAIQAWRVTWINPVSGARNELVGRRSGKDIVQVGTHSDGTPIRWIFSEITADFFLWTGEALEPDGNTWRLEAEFRARRSSFTPPSNAL
jgi:hypothetical protein